VRKCEFAWLGGYALKLSNRSERCVFRENHVHHMGQGGVVTIGGTKEQPHHCAVLGNVMEHLGLIYKHVAGVYVNHGSDLHIAHNRITDIPRYAVSFKSQGEDNLAHRNVAEFNEIRRCNLETNDSGAFETLGYERRDSGNIIRYNLILDSVGMITTPDGKILTPHFTWGVYLDDLSSGTTVYGNIIARNTSGGCCIHGGQNNVFENNIFVQGHEHQVRLQPRSDFMKGNKFVRNIVAYSRPESHLIFSWANQPNMFSECDNNLYWLKGADLRALKTHIMPSGTFAQWQTAGYDTHSLVADPLFVDAAHDDYRLKPDSPALKLGFKAIPVEKIGPKGLENEAQP
jgi:parallel beta-helix repeat protein